MVRLLAQCQRELGDLEAEEKALTQLLTADADALDALTRLIEIARQRQDWSRVHAYAAQLIAINPMLASSQQALLDSASELQDDRAVLSSQRALLQMATGRLGSGPLSVGGRLSAVERSRPSEAACSHGIGRSTALSRRPTHAAELG